MEGTTFTDLGTFDGKNFSFAYDINDSGAVIGEASAITPSGTHTYYKPALWKSDNTMVDLDAWLTKVNPAAASQWSLTDARSISNTGLVTGYGFYVDPQRPQYTRTAAYILDASSLIPEPHCLWLATAILLARRRTRNEVDRGAAIEGIARMPHPVWTASLFHPRSLGRPSHDPPDWARVQVGALMTAEHGGVWTGAG